MIRPSRELVDAVAKQLSETAVRDTQLFPTEEFKEGDSIPIIQDNTNKRIFTSHFIASIRGLLNLDELIDNLEEEIAESKILFGTSAYWEEYESIPREGQLIVYTDKSSKIVDGETVLIPGIKVGSGNAYVQDLPFLGDDLAIEFMNHANNLNIHVVPADKIKWNNKLNVDDDAEVVDGALVFNRN